MADLTKLLGVALPIIQAPMAGGPDTPALASAVGEAGGLGSLGCAYLSAAKIEALGAEMRRRTARPFALNLFVRADEPDEPAARARVLPTLREFRRAVGLPEEPTPTTPPAIESFEAQLEAVLRVRPRVFSFTFGMPTPAQLAALREHGIVVVGSATNVDEAEALDALGVDAIAAQGGEAGGHRGTFLGRFEDSLVGTMALVPQIVRRVRVPVIAAGGIMDGAGIRAALALGAAAVQLGTAFLVCPEAGTAPAHREALGRARQTVVTRAFSGRPARGIRNRFTDAFERLDAAPFPEQQRLTAELRATAAAAGRADLMQMWAGQGAPLVRAMPAAALVETLAREAGLERVTRG